ncbi:mitochondrial ribosome and complex I assembly factor AltMIEF1 [Neocloeon triangulifer]|uniref:mitochondrial ribosome and complex I assembly factor AltMIEF1 n=1 Tax=Neocloeon triangulifer TaxID=2078957 RepID=UPI00286FA9AC|nr:mitochondrial ribosome and complex I assembly factor AltMIEF1 [Neocloeon triangulifer]
MFFVIAFCKHLSLFLFSWLFFNESRTTMSAARSEVLSLYKNILKYGKQIKLTDRDYYKQRIRKEFKSFKNLDAAEDIQFHVERAKAFLDNKRVI